MPVMGTGFQCDIGGGAARQWPGLIQGPPFGMGAAARLRPTAPGDLAVLDQHRANRRIGPDIAEAPRRKAQGMGHMYKVAHSSADGAGRSSDTKRSKSSAAWKFL